MRTTVVVLLGPVCTGKSTQARLLYEELRKRNYKVQSRYLNTYFPAIVALVPRYLRRLKEEVGNQQDVQPVNPPRRWVGLSVVADIFALIVVFFFRIYIGAVFLRPDFIIVEEHFVGVLANYYWAHSTGVLDSHTFNWARRILTKQLAVTSNQLIIIDCPREVLKERWETGRPEHERLDYVEYQRRFFKRLQDLPEVEETTLSITRIDGDRGIPVVSDEIVDAVIRQSVRDTDEHHNSAVGSN